MKPRTERGQISRTEGWQLPKLSLEVGPRDEVYQTPRGVGRGSLDHRPSATPRLGVGEYQRPRPIGELHKLSVGGRGEGDRASRRIETRQDGQPGPLPSESDTPEGLEPRFPETVVEYVFEGAGRT